MSFSNNNNNAYLPKISSGKSPLLNPTVETDESERLSADLATFLSNPSLQAQLADGSLDLGGYARADERIFGSGAMLVESEAMVRFGGDERLPQAILALGSRLEDRFRPGDPVELYRFLGGVLDRCLRKKLGLPA